MEIMNESKKTFISLAVEMRKLKLAGDDLSSFIASKVSVLEKQFMLKRVHKAMM